MTLGEGVAQTVGIPPYGEGGWPNRHITIIVAKELTLLYLGICRRRELVENVIWGRGMAENIRIPS